MVRIRWLLLFPHCDGVLLGGVGELSALGALVAVGETAAVTASWDFVLRLPPRCRGVSFATDAESVRGCTEGCGGASVAAEGLSPFSCPVLAGPFFVCSRAWLPAWFGDASPTVCKVRGVAPVDVPSMGIRFRRSRRMIIAAIKRGWVLYSTEQAAQQLAIFSSSGSGGVVDLAAKRMAAADCVMQSSRGVFAIFVFFRDFAVSLGTAVPGLVVSGVFLA